MDNLVPNVQFFTEFQIPHYIFAVYSSSHMYFSLSDGGKSITPIAFIQGIRLPVFSPSHLGFGYNQIMYIEALLAPYLLVVL